MSRTILSYFLLGIAAVLAGPLAAHAQSPATFTLDGRLFQSGTNSPLQDDVTFRVQILNGDKSCVLYEEVQSQSTAASQGFFLLQIGTLNVNDPKRGSADPRNSMALVFQNSKEIPAAGCASPYHPQPGETRYARIMVTPHSTAITQTMSPDLELNSVPSALVAETLQGSTPQDFVRVNTVPELTQNAVEDLVKGDSLLYLRANSNGASLPVFSSNPSSPAAGQMWFDSSGVIKFYNGSTVQTLGVSGAGITSLTAGAGLSGGTITTSGTISLASLHGSAGTAVKTNYDVYGRVTGSTALTAADIPAVEYSTLLNANGLSPWPVSCGAAQFLRWESTTDVFVCDSVSATQITAGLGYTPVNKAGDTMSGALTLPADGLTVGTSQLVATGGKVGIGTASPTNLLTVWKDQAYNGGVGVPSMTQIQVRNDDPAGYAAFSIWGAGAEQGRMQYNAAMPNIFFTTKTAIPFYIGTNDTIRMTVASGGNVGIGTTAPTEVLDVQGGYGSGLRVRGPTADNNWYGGLQLTNSNVSATGAQISASTNGLFFNYAGTERMRISSSGNVGVGTTNPLYKLDVNGSLNATSLSLSGSVVASSAVAGGGGSGGSFTQSATDAATGARSALTLQNNGTGGVNEYNLVMKNAAGTTTGSVTQAGAATFAASVQAPTIYGSSASGGNLTLDPTQHATKGNILLAPNGGYVGIGTTSPTSYLDVTGSDTSPVGSLRVRSGDGFNSFDANQILFSYAGTANYSHTLRTRHNSTQASGNAFDFYTWNYGIDLAGAVGSKHVMTLDGTGNVGIGTITPPATLSLQGTEIAGGVFTGTTPGLLRVGGGAYNANDLLALDFGMSNQGGGTAPLARIGAEIAVNGSYLRFGTSNLYTSGVTNTAVTIDPAGKVGIGVTAPTQALDVDGSALFGGANRSLQIGSTGTNSVLRFVGNYSTDQAYIQAGGGASGNGVLRFTRLNTATSDMDQFQVYSANSSFTGNLTVGGSLLAKGNYISVARKTSSWGMTSGYTKLKTTIPWNSSTFMAKLRFDGWFYAGSRVFEIGFYLFDSGAGLKFYAPSVETYGNFSPQKVWLSEENGFVSVIFEGSPWGPYGSVNVSIVGEPFGLNQTWLTGWNFVDEGLPSGAVDQVELTPRNSFKNLRAYENFNVTSDTDLSINLGNATSTVSGTTAAPLKRSINFNGYAGKQLGYVRADDMTTSVAYSNLMFGVVQSGMTATELMRISGQTGNVGIGTTNPQGKLHVTAASGLSDVIVERSSGKFAKLAAGTAAGVFMFDATGDFYISPVSSLTATTMDPAKNLKMSGTTGDVSVNGSQLYVSQSTGNVGIGTSTPGDRLTVGAYEPPSSSTNQDKTIGIYGAGAAYFRGRDVTNDIEFIMGTSTVGEAFAGSITAHDFSLRTGNINRVTIKAASGNVGIGVGDPSHPLNVVGGASTAVTVLAELRSNATGAGTGTTLNLVNSPAAGGFTGSASITSIRQADNSGDFQIKTANTGSTATETFRIQGATGRIGIGTSSPAYKLDVQGGDINASGTVKAAGVTLTSDIRYKRDIEPLDDALGKMLQLRGVAYDWRRDEFPQKHFADRRQIGVIAQDVEAQFPELVDTDKDGYKSVNYPALIAPVIEALKALFHRVVGTENRQAAQDLRIAELEKRAENAERENAALKERLLRLEKLVQDKAAP